MASRTAEGKHTTRFIVEVQVGKDSVWVRSANDGLTGHFPTRKAAQAALDPERVSSEGLTYEFARSKAPSYERMKFPAPTLDRDSIIPAGPP